MRKTFPGCCAIDTAEQGARSREHRARKEKPIMFGADHLSQEIAETFANFRDHLTDFGSPSG